MILQNRIIIASFLGWFIAQLLKVILVMVTEKKINFRRFIETGGMPSSHSSLVVALTTSVAKYEGVSSAFFAISFVFAMIIMYDAAGLRRAAGKQAEILNKIIDDIYSHKANIGRLKELLGHTPIEVFAGATLGILTGVFI